MKKAVAFIIIALFAISPVLALYLEFPTERDEATLIIDLNEPASFVANITNKGSSGNIQFYNLLGFRMLPSSSVSISSGETKEIKLDIYAPENFAQRGFYLFQYFIKNQNGEQQERDMLLKIVELKDAFEIGAQEFDPESTSVDIYIFNKEKFNFEKINAKFKSAFFEIDKEFSLASNSKQEFTIKLDKESYNKLRAGFYTMTAEIEVKEKTTEVQGTLKFIEKNIVTDKSNEYGLFVNTYTISKTNEGNVVSNAEVQVKKNIISRLFTTITPAPDSTTRKGFIVYYDWGRDLNPGETLNIKVRTNWFFPFIIILFVVIIVIFTKRSAGTDIELRKRVNFVRAKGGEFALKVSLTVQAKKHIEKVNVIDRLPPLVKVYERFGAEKPVRINEKTKRIEYNFDSLEAGEVRIISYIIYSKVGVLGKFALPSATAVFESNGKVKEAYSNRAFFVAEQKVGKEGEDEF